MSYLSLPMSFAFFHICLRSRKSLYVSDVTCQKYTTLSVELHFNIPRANKLPNKTPTQGSHLTNQCPFRLVINFVFFK